MTMSFKAHLEAMQGHDLGQQASALSPRPLVGGGKIVRPRVLAHVYHIVDTNPRELVRKAAISNLRSCFSNPTALDRGKFAVECRMMRGHRAGISTSRSVQMGAYELTAVSKGVRSYTSTHNLEEAAEPVKTRQLLAPVNSSFMQPTPQSITLPRASHPQPLRCHSPWPGHLKTRTSLPRRRARLFNQVEKKALQKLLPAIVEEP